MGLTDPYRLQNYMGEYPAETGVGSVLAFIQANKWDSDGDGTGTPQEGMMFYNTSNDVMAVYVNANWIAMNSLWTRSGTVLSPLTSTDTIQVGAGSATTPGLAFSSDPNTGLYLESADKISVAVGGGKKASFSTTQVYLQGGDYAAVTVDGTAGITLETVTSGHVEITAAERMTITGFSYVDIDATGGPVMIDATGAISLGAGAASDFTVNADLTLQTTSSGSIALTSARGIDITASAGDVDTNITGSFLVDATNAISLDAVGASNFTVTGGDLDLVSSAKLNLNGDAVDIQAIDGGVTIDATKTSNFTITGTTDVTLTLAAASSTGNADVLISAADEIDLTSGVVDVNVTTALTMDSATFSIDATGTSNLTVTGTGTVALNVGATSATTLADVNISAGREIDLTSSIVDINTTGATTIDSASISLDAAGASNFTVAGANLTVQTTTSGDITVSASDNLALYADTTNIGILLGDLPLGMEGILASVTLNTSANIGLGGLVTNSGTGDSTVEWGATATGGGASIASLRATASGGASSATVNVQSDGEVNLVYDKDAGGSALYIKNNATAVATFSGGISLNSLSGSGITLTTIGSGDDITLNAADDLDFDAAGDLFLDTVGGQRYRAETQFQWFQAGSAAVNLRAEIDVAGAIAFTPFGGQNFAVTTTGVGDIVMTSQDNITVDADGSVFVTYNNAAGSDTLNIYQDTTKIGAFSAAGGVSFTPQTTFEVDSSVNSSTGYSLIDGVYYVNGSNSTAFATLLQNLTGDAQIILGAGTHDISWTTAQTFAYELKIVGSGAGNTFIRFTSGDADCCLNFTNHVEIQSVAFTRSTTMTNQVYGVQLGADYSSIRDCIFQINPQGTESSGYAISVPGDHCTLDNISFNTLFPSGWLIYVTGEDNILSKIKSVGSTCTGGAVWMTSGAVNTKMSDSRFNCAYGSNYATALYCQGNDSRFSNVEVYAGEIDQTGHSPRCLTVEASNNYFSNCVFHGGWDTSTNTGSRITYITGNSNYFSNCYWYQRMMDYTLAGNPTDGMIYVDGGYNTFSGCHITGNKCKCNIYIGSSGDYTKVNGCYVGSAESNNGSYQISAAIYGVSGAHYCNISGNMLRHQGDSLGRCIAGSATRGCNGWSIVGNVCYLASGTIGIYVNYFTYSRIIGNSCSGSTLGNATSGSETTNQYGTSNTAEASGAN